jgi:YVTN family beta-propeller protein
MQAQKNRKGNPMRRTPFPFPRFCGGVAASAKIPARLRAALAGLLLLLPGLAAAAPFAYIANSSSNNVSVIDTASNSVVATVAVGDMPYGVAVNPAGTRVYVINQSANSFSVIDTASNSVIATVAVGDMPYGVAVNPAGTRVYVTNLSANSVSVIDTATNNVTATVPVGSGPVGVAVNPAGTRVYVANLFGNNVSVIDTASNNVTATVAVGSYPVGVAVNPSGTRVYVTNESSHSVSVIDAASNSVIATVAVGSNPNGVAVNLAGTRVYVTNSLSDSVSVIDTASNTVDTTVTVGDYPFGVAVNPAGTRVYVVNTDSNNVMVIDTASNNVIATVPVGSIPYSLGQFIGWPSDTTPDPFSFTSQFGAAPGVVVESNAITVAGIDSAAAIGIVGGSYSINGGTYVTTAGTVNNGDTVTVRQTSSASYGTLTTAPLTIGGVSGAFDVTTLADPAVITSYTAPSATATGNITASFSGGGPGCGYTVSQFIPLTGHTASPPDGTAPAGFAFPYGLFDFTVSDCTPGSTITLVVTYPQALPAGTVYWKYGPSPDGYNCSGVACAAAHWYQMPPAQAVFAGNTVTLTITDGGVGDDDLAANGVIVDQGGPGVPGAAGIPTLSEWALLLLAGLMGLLGMAQVRRRALL